MATWSIVPVSQLVGSLRFDAEFWQPAYLEKENTIRSGNHIALGGLLKVFKKGIFYILAREYSSSGVPFYRSSNVGSILSKNENLAFITGAKHSAECKTALVYGDIMIVKTGKSGASVVLSDSCNVSQDVIATKVKRDLINPFYLAVYLNTRFGSSEMNRWFQGQVQPHLSLEDARKIWIALIPDNEQVLVEKLVIEAANSVLNANNAWTAAYNILEAELGLDKLIFLRLPGYTAQLSDLEISKRFDAQHWQYRFAQMFNQISKFPTKKIREIRRYNRRGVQPIYQHDGEIAVINSQHLGPRHIDYGNLEKTGYQGYIHAPEAHIQPDDLLIYTTGAYVGRTNVYLKKSPAIASNHVNILRLAPGIDPAYMGLVFQSIVGQFQTEKHARGSAQAELYSADIDKFIVPLLPLGKQIEIGDLVRESLVKQQESARLLEAAKTRVEQLIEEAART